jgi:predicted anti-sigma-YlaC factor YlaD
MGVFVAVLTATCTADFISGAVGASRVLSHVPVLVGFLLSTLVVVLCAGPQPPSGEGQGGLDLTPRAVPDLDDVGLDETPQAGQQPRWPTARRSTG